MKLSILCAFAAAVLCAAEQPKAAKPDRAGTANRTAKAAHAAKAAPADLKVPAQAVLVEPGTWKYTDPQGNKWIYRSTPFGIARFEDKPAAEKSAAEAEREEETTAVADGDVIRFQRPGPFGMYRWERKASDLNAQEQSIWDRERARNAGKKQE